MARKSKAAPDALHLLKKDHAEVSSLFTRYEDAIDRGEKAGIADEICRKLTIHSLCEEELLYPAAHASIDFNHDPHSAIIDASQTRVSGGHLLNLFIWFDNEWGFANRLLDVAQHWLLQRSQTGT